MRILVLFFLVTFSLTCFSQTDISGDSLNIEGKIFERVDAEARFPGDEAGWRKYLETSLDPTAPVENGAPIGIYTVVVQFVVDKSGILSDVKALTNFGYGMEQQVIRIIQKGPQWIPAMYR